MSLTLLPLFRLVFKVPHLGSGLCLWTDFSDYYTPGITGHNNNKRFHHRAGRWSRTSLSETRQWSRSSVTCNATQMRASRPKLDQSYFLLGFLHLRPTPYPRNTTANLAVRSVSAHFVTMVTQAFLVTQKEPSHAPQ